MSDYLGNRKPSRFVGPQAPNVETLTSNKTLTVASPQIQVLTPSGANRNATLPDPKAGLNKGHWFTISNPIGTSYNIVVKKSNASTLITLNPGEWTEVICGSTDFIVLTYNGVDFGTTGFKTDVVDESTSGSGVTVDGLLIKDGQIQGTAPILADTISEKTAATGVTIDSLLIKDGLISANFIARATIAVANATGGGTNSGLTLALTRLDGSTAITVAKQVMIRATAAQYDPGAVSSHPTFGTATTGSIIASGNGWCLAETDATGAFACTVSNSSDETLYFSACTANSGLSTVDNYCIVAGSNSDAAAWSA